MQAGRPDEGDVAHLSCERDPVIGQPELRRELLDVVVLPGAHVAPDREMKRRETFRFGPAYRLDLGKAIEHAEIDVVRIGGGDLAEPLIMVGDVRGNGEP